MNFLLRPLLTVLYALLISGALLLFFGISDEPDLAVAWTLTSNDIARAKKILNEGSKNNINAIGTLELSQADVNLAANYLVNRYIKSAVQVVLQDHKLKVILTVRLPANSFGQYLNISFRLASNTQTNLPELISCKVGKLAFPAPIASWLIKTFIEHSSLNEYVLLATRHIRAVSIGADRINLYYYASLSSLLPQSNKHLDTHHAALAFYKQSIAIIIEHHNKEWLLSLADLLKPLFALAYQRSDIESAIEENRTLIMAVNDYVNQKETQPFLTEPSPPTSPIYYPAYLYKRSDLAQHFIASAALTVSVNQQVAKVVGEEKELSDAQEGGSGFSFIDLAADKAGTRFAQIAIGSNESARRLQQIMAGIHDYSAFMPNPTDLPEKMTLEEFKQRYESVNSPAYLSLSQLIEARLNALALYQ